MKITDVPLHFAGSVPSGIEAGKRLLKLQQLDAGAHPVEPIPIHLNEWISPGVTIFRETTRSQEQYLQVQLLLSPPDKFAQAYTPNRFAVLPIPTTVIN